VSKLLLACGMFVMLFLTACNSSGYLEVVNQTSYNVYFSIEGINYTVPAHESKSVEVETGTQTWLTGVRVKKIPLEIYGETWMIRLWDGNEAIYVKDTHVNIHSGETTRIYCAPIIAAVKVKNLSYQSVIKMTCTKHFSTFNEVTKEIILPDSIQTGQEFFAPLDAAEPDYQFYYTFQLKMSDGNWVSYGSASTVLYPDHEYMINLVDLVARKLQ